MSRLVVMIGRLLFCVFAIFFVHIVCKIGVNVVLLQPKWDNIF